MIVHADLNAVQIECSRRQAARDNTREVGLAFEAAIEVLGLDRPFRCEHDLDTGADGPAGMELAIRNAHAERRGGDAVVGPGVAAGAVEEDLIESVAEAATNGAGTFLRNYRVEQQRAACELWPKGQVDSNYTARVKSDAPVLLVSSTTDPVTPPHGAAEAAEGLSRSTQLLVPSGPHSPATRCLMGIVTEFIKAASASALDTACLTESRRPPFALALP